MQLQIQIEQNLFLYLALAEPVAQVPGPGDGGPPARLGGRYRCRGPHPNASAGSAAITRRSASIPETRHIPTVRARTCSARSGSKSMGKLLTAARTVYTVRLARTPPTKPTRDRINDWSRTTA